MGRYTYTEKEKDLNKVLKMNQDEANELIDRTDVMNQEINSAISSSEELIKSLNMEIPKKPGVKHTRIFDEITECPNYESLVVKARTKYKEDIEFEDLLTAKEFQEAYNRVDEIHAQFAQNTSIINKIDLSFLAIATALQTAKSLMFPIIANKLGYGNTIDRSTRLDHNAPSIETAQRNANNEFKQRHKAHGNGYWMNILYQTPAYDITRGSTDIGKNMEGGYHRVHTLGHDPILGWLFGTANILTDTITFETFQTNRVIRKPSMRITTETLSVFGLLQESYEMIKADYLNLPAAIFAQAQHLKSDEYTKLGLPVPILQTIDANFASKLYKSGYDNLCFLRDVKIIGGSAAISILIDMMIGLVHGLFNKDNIQKDLYEVRTKKILLISHTIATTSNILQTLFTQNIKNLDIGGLIVTVFRLFSDIRFMARIKEEFIQQELTNDLKKELKRLEEI